MRMDYTTYLNYLNERLVLSNLSADLLASIYTYAYKNNSSKYNYILDELLREALGDDLEEEEYKALCDEDTKLYECVSDYQGGDWAVGIIETIEQWRQHAIGWAETDGADGIIKELQELPQDKVIDYIQDFWEIEIVELKGLE